MKIRFIVGGCCVSLCNFCFPSKSDTLRYESGSVSGSSISPPAPASFAYSSVNNDNGIILQPFNLLIDDSSISLRIPRPLDRDVVSMPVNHVVTPLKLNEVECNSLRQSLLNRMRNCIYSFGKSLFKGDTTRLPVKLSIGYGRDLTSSSQLKVKFLSLQNESVLHHEVGYVPLVPRSPRITPPQLSLSTSSLDSVKFNSFDRNTGGLSSSIDKWDFFI